MRNALKILATGLACVGIALSATPAHAQTISPTAGHASVGGLLGYGFDDGVNFGLGVRAGYTLPMNLYLGGTFVYHFGKSEGPVSTKLYYLGVEGGYDIAVSSIVIRPYLGLGSATAKANVDTICYGTTCLNGGSVSDSKFAVWPGATLLYPIDNFFIGGDARFLVVSEANAFSLFATGGVQF